MTEKQCSHRFLYKICIVLYVKHMRVLDGLFFYNAKNNAILEADFPGLLIK
jgi:hypothetical protein